MARQKQKASESKQNANDKPLDDLTGTALNIRARKYGLYRHLESDDLLRSRVFAAMDRIPNTDHVWYMLRTTWPEYSFVVTVEQEKPKGLLRRLLALLLPMKAPTFVQVFAYVPEGVKTMNPSLLFGDILSTAIPAGTRWELKLFWCQSI